ncbi:MAG: hypothetical protein COA29_04765 [Porticoccus sp.]|nr:MAG: hypothetical protein COA29_04765 [Porticoccus sp.]
MDTQYIEYAYIFNLENAQSHRRTNRQVAVLRIFSAIASCLLATTYQRYTTINKKLDLIWA